jgi:tetratricopeptide (TPR) repeat protein
MSLALAAQALPPAACGGLLDSGNACYERFNNGRALGYFRRAHEECPQSYEELMKYTRALIDLGEDTTPNSAESLFVRSARCADTLVQRFPDSGQPYFLRAVATGSTAALRRGARKVAMVRAIEVDIKHAIRLDPTFAPAYIVLGRYYREIAQANPLLKAIARLLFGGVPKGTLRDSEDFLQKAIALSPRNVDAHLELARTEVALHHREEALDLLLAMEDLPATWHMDDRLKEKGRTLQAQLRR